MKLSIWSWLAWIVAVVAMGGSLYASEVAHWTPCLLCWYQRIAMYPLVLILLVGAITNDKHLPRYVLPVSIVGGAIALYHNLLQWGVVQTNGSCSAYLPSCEFEIHRWFGFVTLPVLSLTAFILISLAMVAIIVRSRR